MASGDVIRPESHEIDTAARRIVPTIFPTSWEHREPGGRDYGIDMQVEVFRSGVATGATLLLQIKGTTRLLDENEPLHTFDIPVSTLKYAELFAVPFLLVLCPVNRQPARCYYLWLQEYIEVVLNYDRPAWKQNSSTVRVKIPSDNLMPGCDTHLAWIAEEPIRIKSWGRLAHLYHEMSWEMKDLIIMLEENLLDPAKVKRAIAHARELTELPALGTKVDGTGSKFLHETVFLPLSQMLAVLEEGGDLTAERLHRIHGLQFRQMVETEEDDSFLRMVFVSHFESTLHSLGLLLSTYFDTRLRNTLWRNDNDHIF